MKKISAFLVGAGLIASSVLAADPVTSVNIVGYSKIDCLKGKVVLVNTAFKKVGGGSLNASDVVGDQLPLGSSIYAYDPTLPGYIADNSEESGWTTNINFAGNMGFWISVPSDAVSNSYAVVLSGEAPLNLADTNKVYSGITLLGYPYTASVAWTNTTLAKSAQPGDSLYVYNPTNGYTSYNMEEGGWSDPSLIISISMGFWYQTSSSTFTNIEVRPYNP